MDQWTIKTLLIPQRISTFFLGGGLIKLFIQNFAMGPFFDMFIYRLPVRMLKYSTATFLSLVEHQEQQKQFWNQYYKAAAPSIVVGLRRTK